MKKFVFHTIITIGLSGSACALPTSASAQATASAPPASGQASTASSRYPNHADFEQQYDRFKLNLEDPVEKNYAGATAMAKCVVRRAKGAGASYFGGPTTDDPAYEKLTGVLTGKYRNCLNKSVSGIPMFVVNAALAEQLLIEDKTVFPDKPLELNVDDAEAFYLADGKISSLDGLSRCIAVNSPGLVQKLLATDPKSDEEQLAIEAAYAATPECGVATPPKISPLEHRAMLATGLYQWNSKS